MAKGGRLWHSIRRVWITVGLTGTLVFVAWSLVAYQPDATARGATISDDEVAVSHEEGVWSFLPSSERDGAASLIFFPGSLVDPVAYAPLARAAALSGHRAYIIELPLRGAFGGAESPAINDRLNRVLGTDRAPGWVVAGHSRGAVVASRGASEERAGMLGVVIIGSSHPRDVDLSGLAIPVTKIVGTRDGLASPEEVEANAAMLPAHTRWVWIDGGNHSHFGWYGFQPGDRRATISAAAQRGQMIKALLDMLEEASDPAPAS